MDLQEVFAGNLRRLRHAKGMSQDDLANEAEISRSCQSQLEKGAFYASPKIIGKACGRVVEIHFRLNGRGAAESRSRRVGFP